MYSYVQFRSTSAFNTAKQIRGKQIWFPTTGLKLLTRLKNVKSKRLHAGCAYHHLSVRPPSSTARHMTSPFRQIRPCQRSWLKRICFLHGLHCILNRSVELCWSAADMGYGVWPLDAPLRWQSATCRVKKVGRYIRCRQQGQRDRTRFSYFHICR